MTMTPGIRKFALTAHVTSSVGWLGAVAGFLALAVAGLTHHNPQIVRASYLAMELIGWCVIVPLSVASLLTGLAQGLGTPWGLLRHYWVVAKLLITVFATILLLVHMQPVGRIAGVAIERTLFTGEYHGLRVQLIFDAASAVVVLLIAIALSVFKPWGMTAFGRRKQQEERVGTISVARHDLTTTAPRWVKIFWIVVGILVLLFAILHLTGNAPGGHFGHGK
jgi:hypothetical protein